MKIAILCPDDTTIWTFRKGLVKSLVEKGNDVYLICPPGDYINKLKNLGIMHVSIEFNRFINPLKDIKYLIQSYRILRKHKFDVVHNMTIKPNIYGAIAAKLANVGTILGSVEGLGAIYTDNLLFKFRLLKPFITGVYWLGCYFSNRVWFLNKDDLLFFVSKRMINIKKTVIIKTWVNITDYSPETVDNNHVHNLKKEFRINKDTKVILMISRFLWSKGVREFVESYNIIRNKYVDIKFILVGGFEKTNPGSVPKKYLMEKNSNSFQVLDFRNDIRELIFLSTLVVLPSYYREGTPGVLLEAMAMGKPIVTTDNVGCREAVEDGKNGYLVPIRDSKALADAIEILLNDDDKRKIFGQYSRVKVEREFDEDINVNLLLNKLYQI